MVHGLQIFFILEINLHCSHNKVELIPHCFVEQKLYIMVLIHVMNLDIDVEVETENQNLDKETDYTGPQPPVDSEWSETE